jgi:hypothetical protein
VYQLPSTILQPLTGYSAIHTYQKKGINTRVCHVRPRDQVVIHSGERKQNPESTYDPLKGLRKMKVSRALDSSLPTAFVEHLQMMQDDPDVIIKGDPIKIKLDPKARLCHLLLDSVSPKSTQLSTIYTIEQNTYFSSKEESFS